MNAVRLAAVQVMCLMMTSEPVLAQASDSSRDADDEDTLRTDSGECFVSSAVLDMIVYNDAAIYVETRTRHFLLTPSGQCNNLRRAYVRNAAQFVPIGRRICPGDGSHILYESGGRNRVCSIGAIVEMENRQQVRDIAEQRIRVTNEDLIITRELDSPDESQ